MLRPEQRVQFDRDGIVKIEAAFTEGQAARMSDVVWGELRRRYSIERDDPSTWYRHAPTGMKSSKKHWAFTPIFGPVLTEVLDDLFGPGQWTTPKHAGQVLITMPNAMEWRVPSGLWHADFQYLFPPEGVSAVKIWVLFAAVGPSGGGTLQLAGSHRLMIRYLRGRSGDELEYKRVRDGFMRSHPWLKALINDDSDPQRNARSMATGVEIDSVTLRVVELTGEPGDVFVTHPWVMHAVAPNVTNTPRMMRSVPVYHVRYAREPTEQESPGEREKAPETPHEDE